MKLSAMDEMDKAMQAEGDLHTLTRAAEIQGDSKRMAAAHGALKKKARELKTVHKTIKASRALAVSGKC